MNYAPLAKPVACDMAGTVIAEALYVHVMDAVEVVPRTCPGADMHRKDAERKYAAEMAKGRTPVVRAEWTRLKCTWFDHDGRRHYCRYAYGFADRKDETVRREVGLLRSECVERAVDTLPIVTLCTQQRMNRPPGG